MADRTHVLPLPPDGRFDPACHVAKVRCLRLGWFAISAVLAFAATARGALGDGRTERSKLELIACMPAGVESILVRTIEDPHESPKAEPVTDRSNSTTNTIDRTDRPQPLCGFYEAMWRACPIFSVVGGSEFQLPKATNAEDDPRAIGIGVGNANERRVFQTRYSLTHLRAALESCAAAHCVERNSRVFYRLTDKTEYGGPYAVNPTEEPRFVGFSGDFTVVMTESEPELFTMLESLDQHRVEIPEKWIEAACAIDLDMPLVILRSFRLEHGAPPKPDEPLFWFDWGNEFDPELRIYSFGLAANKGASQVQVCMVTVIQDSSEHRYRELKDGESGSYFWREGPYYVMLIRMALPKLDEYMPSWYLESIYGRRICF